VAEPVHVPELGLFDGGGASALTPELKDRDIDEHLDLNDEDMIALRRLADSDLRVAGAAQRILENIGDEG
jgi:hypothetical protein